MLIRGSMAAPLFQYTPVTRYLWYDVAMKYALFLRGINVGGIKVPMADLKDCLTGLGLEEVKTYLQTGNVTFVSGLSEAELKSKIEQALTDRFGYTAYVLLYPAEILRDVIDGYPFELNESMHRYALFCQSKEVIDELVAHKDELDPKVEMIAPGSVVVYWRVPKGMTLDTTFSKIIAKPKYKATTTNRNINTLEKMV